MLPLMRWRLRAQPPTSVFRFLDALLEASSELPLVPALVAGERENLKDIVKVLQSAAKCCIASAFVVQWAAFGMPELDAVGRRDAFAEMVVHHGAGAAVSDGGLTARIWFVSFCADALAAFTLAAWQLCPPRHVVAEGGVTAELLFLRLVRTARHFSRRHWFLLHGR